MRRRRALRLTAQLLPALAAGAVLRTYNLPGQVLAGDELHAVRAALTLPVAELLTTYQVADPCLPLAAFFRALLDRGVVFTEMTFRAPGLAASLLALLVLPLFARRTLGTAGAAAYGWLLALSPLLVLYGRLVRPYALVTLLATAAVLLFYRWLRRPTPAAAVGYGLLAAASVYVHLGSGPFVATPLAFAALDAWRRPGAPGARQLLLPVAAFAGSVAAFAVPAAPSLLRLIEIKRGGTRFDPEAAGPMLIMQAGGGGAVVAGLFWLTALAGLFLLWRRQRHFALYSVTLVAGHIGGLALLHPLGMANPVILNRYLLPVTPVVLIWIAVALARARFRSGRPARWLAPAALALWLVTGALADPELRRSSFMHHEDFLRLGSPKAALPAAAIPPLYEGLPETGDGSLVEAPVHSSWRFSRTPYIFQRLHRRPVRIATLEPLLCDARLALRNHLCPRPKELLASEARFLALHRDRPGREAQILPSRWIRPPRARRKPQRQEALRDGGPALARRLEEAWGPPDETWEDVLLWDLERLRSAKATAGRDSRNVSR